MKEKILQVEKLCGEDWFDLFPWFGYILEYYKGEFQADLMDEYGIVFNDSDDPLTCLNECPSQDRLGDVLSFMQTRDDEVLQEVLGDIESLIDQGYFDPEKEEEDFSAQEYDLAEKCSKYGYPIE